MGAMAAAPTTRGSGPEPAAATPAPQPPALTPKIEKLAPVAATDPRLDPALELPLDEQRRLLAIHDAMPRFDAFDVLGMVPTVEAKLVKRAFHLVSRRYHPDSYYGKQLGAFRPLMTELFRRAKQAFDELEDDAARARAFAIAMAAHVPPRARAMTPSATAAAAGLPGFAPDGGAPAAGMPPRARLSTPTEIPRGRAMTPPAITMAAHEAGRGAMPRARRETPSDADLAGAAAAAGSGLPHAASRLDEEERLARDTERRRRIAERMGMSDAQRQRAAQYAEQARAEEADGRFGAAASLWRLAKEADPSADEYHSRWQAALTSARVTRAHHAFAQATALRKVGDVEAAARLFIDAAEANPTAQHLAEAAYVIRETDAVRARNFAMSALDAGIAAQQSGKPLTAGERGRVHLCAAAAFLAAGQQHSARQQVGEARALIPDDEDLKRLLKSMKLT
jgi:tetratricopeptide (TPR) repeat protein